MNQQQYDAWTKPLRENPRAARLLVNANKALTILGYVAFPLLLVSQAIAGSWDMAVRTLIVAGAGFVSLSLFRRLVNAPRPYETLAIEPLIAKETHGKSFPSRHTFSMFMIAFCWLAWCAPVGVVLVLTSIDIGVTRVLGGVHWPRDVVAAFAWAAVFALIGFLLVP